MEKFEPPGEQKLGGFLRCPFPSCYGGREVDQVSLRINAAMDKLERKMENFQHSCEDFRSMRSEVTQLQKDFVRLEVKHDKDLENVEERLVSISSNMISKPDADSMMKTMGTVLGVIFTIVQIVIGLIIMQMGKN